MITTDWRFTQHLLSLIWNSLPNALILDSKDTEAFEAEIKEYVSLILASIVQMPLCSYYLKYLTYHVCALLIYIL